MGTRQWLLFNEAHRRLAATRVLEVPCSPADLPTAIQELLDTWNTSADAAFQASLETKGRLMRWASSSRLPSLRHYFLLERPQGLMVTFGISANHVVDQGFNPDTRGWVAGITPEDSDNDGTIYLSIVLEKWSIDADGRMFNGRRYVQMLDGVVAALHGRYVSDPVRQEDCYFDSES